MNKQKDKIVALGDSLTYGFPYSPGDAWVRLLRDLTGWQILNKGVNGDTTGQMLKRFKRDCLAYEPVGVIITGGTNDAFARIDVDAVLANIAAMVKGALEHGIKAVIGLPPPVNPPQDEKFLALYRAEMQGFALENSLGVIDFYNAFLSGSGRVRTELFSDTSHPNLEGHKIMADTAWHSLREIFGFAAK
ncbi:MAG: GDSL-type esterase/lipase family protein [Sporomusaceae bacterium]|nr:GDSL-type esterase/lipase family protein [Sporomusaceae bacterium]